MIIIILFIAGCSPSTPEEPAPNVDVPSQQEIPYVEYERDGELYSGIEYDAQTDAMTWLKENTPEGTLVLSWWDYGHQIRGSAQRDAIVWEPSKEILFTTVASYIVMDDDERAQVECPVCSPHDRIVDVVDALLAETPEETASVMEKYNAEYVVVTEEEKSKLYALLIVAGLETDDYITRDYVPKDAASGFMVLRMANGEEISGFELVFDDESTRIYRLVSPEEGV